jgi:DNA-binding CsgD family transcriptional regulator
LASGDDRDDVQIVVRRATLSLDSDLEPDAELLTRAAHRAVWQVDLPLADRLADAAIRAGGADARFVRAFLLSWQGDGQRADAVLADAPAGLTDGETSRLAFLGAVNRLFSLADPAGAKRLIDDVSESLPPHARDCIDAARTIYWAAMGKPEPAREAYQRITADQLPDGAARMTAWAITVALGEAGRATEAVVAAEAGYSMAFRGFLVVTDAHASALMLSGRVADAHDVAETLRQRASDYPSPQLSPVGTALAGRAALAAGRLDTACSLLGPAVELLTASSAAVGLNYRYRLPHATALAMRGFIDDASAAFIALKTHRHPGWQHLDYELGIAQAWVSACQGAVGEAIEIALSAAQTASSNGQFAAEVMCLQTAVQFGDGSSHPRLRALEAIVEGPRAGIASRFAAALKGGEAAELRAVSDDFEQMGDLVAAADAAAHAAAEFRRQGLRGSALGCVARAQALAIACGGAVTPALRQATERVPLTSREREIVMLLAAGLSNRDVAKRLTLSVRTVEGHIYRAMARTGTASRDELINLLPAMNT